MFSIVMTLLVLIALAVPILFVAKIVRRVREMSQRLQDPTRLQRVFAESAAAALRRAGADPKAIAKLEVRGMDQSAAQPPELPRPLFEAAQRNPRPRRQHRPAPTVGFDMGDRFRLSEPPEISEPRGPLPFSVNWLAAAALVGAAAYHLMR